MSISSPINEKSPQICHRLRGLIRGCTGSLGAGVGGGGGGI